MQKESICPVQADIQTAVSSFHVWVSVKYESKQPKNDQFCQAISDVFFLPLWVGRWAGGWRCADRQWQKKSYPGLYVKV